MTWTPTGRPSAAGPERDRHGGVPGKVRRHRAHVGEVHGQRVIGALAEAERHRGRRGGQQHVKPLVGGGEVPQHQRPHLERLAVVGVVVARGKRERAEHDASLDLVAEPGGAGGHVHVDRRGGRYPQAVADTVVAGEVAGGLRRGDEEVRREAVDRSGNAHLTDVGPGRRKSFRGGGDAGRHVAVGALAGELGDNPHPQAVDVIAESGGQIADRLGDRRRVQGIVPGDDRIQQGRIGDRAGHRADLVERRGERHEAVTRHPPVGGLHADDPAQRRGLADRAAGVTAQRHRGHSRGNGRGTATR